MFGKPEESRVNENVLKILMKKQRFEAFYEEFVKNFVTSKSNKEFHNFRLAYHNRIREVGLFYIRNSETCSSMTDLFK